MIDWLQIHKADEDAHHAKDHAARHESGADDEIDISGLTGGYSLDDLKTDHPTLSGTELHNPKAHASGHASGEADDVVAVIGDPNSHASRHASGGDDALGAGSLVTAMIAAGEFNVADKLVKLDASADVPDAQIPTLAYSKLNLTGEILMADLATAIKNAANGLAVLDGSALVPLAQMFSKMTHGTHSHTSGGESTIAHGLGEVPKLILWRNTGKVSIREQHSAVDSTHSTRIHDDAPGGATTATNATNWYVESGETTGTIHWEAWA